MWYKLRQAKREKLDLEYNYFLRVDQVMERMSSVVGDSDFEFST